MHGRAHARPGGGGMFVCWGGRVWQGVCMAGRRGGCGVREAERATEASGTHPTGLHSCP